MTSPSLMDSGAPGQGYGEEPQQSNDELLLSFANERGISVEWLKNAGIDICPPSGEKPGWVRIPYRHMTGVWGYRYRNPHPTSKSDRYWNPSGQAVHTYNPYNHGPGSTEIWFAEGEFDAVVLNELGYPSVGLGGTGIAEKLMRKSWLRLYRGARIFIVFDGDEYGHKAALGLRDGLDNRGIRSTLVHVPDGHDVSSWYVEDEEGLRRQLDSERSRT